MDEETKVGRRFWPLEWAKDESFWKDVAKSSLSALIVIVIAYVYGVATGYLQRPEIASFLGAAFVFASVAVPLGICIGLIRAAIRDNRDKQTLKIYLLSAGIILLFGVLAVLDYFPQFHGG